MYNQTEKVNIRPKSYLPVFRVSEGDVGRTLTAHLVSDEGDISIPGGATVTMAGTKPSGLGYTVTGTVDDADVSFETDAVMTDEPGRIVSEIRIVQDGTVIGTTNVVLSVEPNPHPDDTTDGRGEPLVNEITALLEQITAQADRVEEYSGKVLNMTVTAHESDEVTVTKTEGEVVNLDFGLPRGPQGPQGIPGEDGQDGVTPDFTIGTVETLAPGEQATATITGTDEDPVLNLGIPRGAKGDKGDPGEVSLETLAKVMVSDTASGAIASFTDGSDVLPAKSVLVTLAPKQSGSGTPSPDNIRPISGWDEVDVSVSAITPPDNKRKASDNLFDGEHNEMVQLHIPSGTAVCVSALGSGVDFRYYDADKVEIDRWTLSTYAGDGRYYRSFVTIGAKDAEYVLFYGVERTDYMVETGVSSPSSYVPHGTTYTQDIEATYTPTVQENEPYQFKRTGDAGGDRESIELVGGTVAWNQLVQNGDFANDTGWGTRYATISIADGIATFTPSSEGTVRGIVQENMGEYAKANHKYLGLATVKPPKQVQMNLSLVGSAGGRTIIPANVWTTFGQVFTYSNPAFKERLAIYCDTNLTTSDTVQVRNAQLFDLTQMFGSTIADYIYSLERATAGAGVAWFRKYFPEDYYPYSQPTLQSVQATAHKTYDADGDVIGNYALDSSLTLRGIPKLDASNNLYYDGDIYESDGSVTRKYSQGTISVTSVYTHPNNNVVDFAVFATSSTYAQPLSIFGEKINSVATTYGSVTTNGVALIFNASTKLVAVSIPKGTSLADAQTLLNGSAYVYELATPTTETADSFEEIQICSPYGTEEFVDNRAVPIPVGNNTQYYTRDIYGGTLDLVSGVLTVDRAMVTLDGSSDESLNVTPLENFTQVGWGNYISIGKPLGTFVCDTFAFEKNGNSYVTGLGHIWGGSVPRCFMGFPTTVTDIASVRQWLSEHPTTIVYELATPTTFQCDPQTIQTLIGDNNVWGGSGVSIDYYADTKLYIEKMLGA